MMQCTSSGRGSADARSTVAAPMDTPYSVTGPRSSGLVRIYRTQFRQSHRSRTPKVMVLPSLSPWAR